ncbi:MAG: transcription termination/antitermination protein NusG [Gemmataceae bacterium]
MTDTDTDPDTTPVEEPSTDTLAPAPEVASVEVADPDDVLDTVSDVTIPAELSDLVPSAEPAAPPVASAFADVLAEPAAPENRKQWYVIKVVSGREDSIKAALERKIKIENVESYFGQIVIPYERVMEVRKVKETKNGEKITKEKRIERKRKKFPGYLMAEVEFNDQILYVFRETNGVGDFVGSSPGKPPQPMNDRDVQAMLHGMTPDDPKGGKRSGPKPKVKIDLEKGDKVRIRDGAFAGMEGEVKEVSEAKDETETPKMTVEVSIFGRPVKIENLEFWQIDKL